MQCYLFSYSVESLSLFMGTQQANHLGNNKQVTEITLSTIMFVKARYPPKCKVSTIKFYSGEHSFFSTWRFNCWYQRKPLPQSAHTCGSFLVCLITCFCRLRISQFLYVQQSQYHHVPPCFLTCFCDSESHFKCFFAVCCHTFKWSFRSVWVPVSI